MSRAVNRSVYVDFDAPMCSSGKRAFGTEEEARALLGQAIELRKHEAGRKPGLVEKAIYRCKDCGCWHLTSRNTRRPRRRGRR